MSCMHYYIYKCDVCTHMPLSFVYRQIIYGLICVQVHMYISYTHAGRSVLDALTGSYNFHRNFDNTFAFTWIVHVMTHIHRIWILCLYVYTLEVNNNGMGWPNKSSPFGFCRSFSANESRTVGLLCSKWHAMSVNDTQCLKWHAMSVLCAVLALIVYTYASCWS